MGDALITDLYELNMAASFLRRQMTEPATFSLFVRRLPASRGFLVAAGLQDCLEYLERFAFDHDDLAWMTSAGFPSDVVERFATLRFTGQVQAVPEGRVVTAGEPLLEVTAPLPEAQLVETYLLNQITFQTAVATKAARCTLAAGDIELVDFALRRTQGVSAGMAVARCSALAGFVGTSNVAAARRYHLEAAGTMAHSYIQAFPNEHAAFSAFAQDLPERTTFVVDTYDTLAGVGAAIDVVKELDLQGSVGVRLDSGDLAALAVETRRLLDAAGLGRVKIFVSGSLDEYALEALRRDGVPIDAAGIGTKMGVSDDAPSLDTVYKLVATAGRPVLKLSADKATLPGEKQVWRGGPPTHDLVATRQEAGPSGAEPLLVAVMDHGQRIGAPDTIEAARRRLRGDLGALDPSARQLRDPTPLSVSISERLWALNQAVSAEHGQPARRS